MQDLLNRITKYSIYVLAFLLPVFWLPFSFEMFEYNKQYLLFFLVSLGFLAWLAKQVFYDKEIKFRHSPIDYLVLGFLLISAVSAVLSVDQNSSVFGFYGRFSNGLIGLLGLGALYFLITNTVENGKSSLGKILDLFLYSNFLAVLSGYFSVFGVWGRINSFFPLPQVMLQPTFNFLAGSLESMAIFLAAVIVLLAGLLMAKPKNIFYWISLLASLGLLMIVNFQPAWIILLASMVLLVAVVLAKRIFRDDVNRLFIPIFLIVMAAVIMVWQPFRMNLPQEQVLPQQLSWEVAAKSATDNVKNVFLGTGIGTFQYDFAKYKPQSFNQNWMWQIRFDRAGSHFAELLGTVGFPGLIVYLGIIALFLLISWFSVSKKEFAGLPLTMVFAALAVSQFVFYQNTSLAFVFWLILGLSAVAWREKYPALTQEKRVSFKNFPEASLIFLTLVIILGVAVLALYFYGAKYYLADTDYLKALSALGESRVSGLEAAVNQNPTFPSYRTVLARAYLIEALQEMQKEKPEQNAEKIQVLVARAIDQARIASLLQPNQVANWETSGVIYREIGAVAAGATEWGIKSFEKAIELEPTNPVLYTELGRLYLAMGEKDKAKNNFSKALEEKSDYVTATIQLALLLEQDNIIDEAVTKIENLVISNPYNVEARFQLGRLYYNNGRIDDAIGQFQSVVILAPGHSNAHYSLGVAYVAQGKKNLAIQEFKKVLELNPDNADVLQKLKNLGAR